jgi:hypothetical protein
MGSHRHCDQINFCGPFPEQLGGRPRKKKEGDYY